jgi:hypothetical protein
MFYKINKLIRNPGIILLFFIGRCRFIPDSIYLKIKFKIITKKNLNLKDPQTFNEKLQWLKIYDRKSIYTNLVDKYEVRNFIINKIGEEYLIPLIGVYNKFEDIDFYQLPNQFVLKPNHTSGNVFVCKDKSQINLVKLKTEVNQWLKRRYYWEHREWPYKNIEPKIICEKYMVDESGTELKDYKFFCFNGEPKVLFVASNRGIDTKYDFYDIAFNHLPIMVQDNSRIEFFKPPGFDKMIQLAKILSQGIPHVRIDLYDINGKVYFGELTFYHLSGYDKFEPQYDKLFGEWLDLPLEQI